MKAKALHITTHEGNDFLSDILLELPDGSKVTAVCAGYFADHLLTGQEEDYRVLYVDDEEPAYYYIIGFTREEVIMPTPLEYQLVIDPFDAIWHSMRTNALNPYGSKQKTTIQFENDFIARSSDEGTVFPLFRAEDIEVVPEEAIDEHHTRVVLRAKRNALERALDLHFGAGEWTIDCRDYQDHAVCAVSYHKFHTLGCGFDSLSAKPDLTRCENEALCDACGFMGLGAELYHIPSAIVSSGLVTDENGASSLEHSYSVGAISYMIRRVDGRAEIVITDYTLAKTEYEQLSTI